MVGFVLPPVDHIAREMAPVEYLVEVLDRKNLHRLPDFGQAIRSVRKHFPKDAKSVCIVCIRADDERWLISVGPRGGWKKIWNYGRGY